MSWPPSARLSGAVAAQQPPQHQRDHHHLERHGHRGQHVQLRQVADRADEHGEDRDQDRLRRVQPDLVAQQRLAEHAELGQQDQHGDDVGAPGVHARCVGRDISHLPGTR